MSGTAEVIPAQLIEHDEEDVFSFAGQENSPKGAIHSPVLA
jgi:hypothetical protein